LGGLEINDLRKELKIPETDHLKKNGTYLRDIYILLIVVLSVPGLESRNYSGQLLSMVKRKRYTNGS